MFSPLVGKIPLRREQLLTAVSWPGEFHGLYSPWGLKELDMTERLSLSLLVYVENLLELVSLVKLQKERSMEEKHSFIY